MNHPSLQELTEVVHGLRPSLEHVDSCDACRGTTEALHRELTLLRRAEARVPVPARRRRSVGLIPVALAAIALLAITGWIVGWPSRRPVPEAPGQEKIAKVEDLVTAFLEGSDDESGSARKALVRRSSEALPLLINARQEDRSIRRADPLRTLILELKEKEAGPAFADTFKTLKAQRMTVDMQGVPLDTVLAYIHELMGVNVMADPELHPDKLPVTLKVQDVSLAQALDVLCAAMSAEYDGRYGALFVASRARLAALPRQGQWRKQDVSGDGRKLLEKLDSVKMNLSFEATLLEDLLGFVKVFGGVTFILDAAAREDLKVPVTIKVQDGPLGSVLDGLLLPRGLDLRIEGNVLKIFTPRGK